MADQTNPLASRDAAVARALAEHAAAVGTIVRPDRIRGIEDEQDDIDLDNEDGRIAVRVLKTRDESVLYESEAGFIDPYWDVEVVEDPAGETLGVPHPWIDGPTVEYAVPGAAPPAPAAAAAPVEAPPVEAWRAVALDEEAMVEGYGTLVEAEVSEVEADGSPGAVLAFCRLDDMHRIAAVPALERALGAFGRLLQDVEDVECDPMAHGMPIENADHPWHVRVMEARAALAAAEAALAAGAAAAAAPSPS